MRITMGQNRGGASRAAKKPLSHRKWSGPPPWLIILNHLGLSMRQPSRFSGVPCDHLRRLSSSSPSSRRRLHPPKAAFSSSPTRPTATESTSASPRATAAVRRPHAPIANHGILRRPPPTAVSIPTRLPARFPRSPAAVRTAIATNTSRLPASADVNDERCGRSATRAPRKRRAVAETGGYGLSLGVVISRHPL